MAILNGKADIAASRAVFERLYADYNKREFVSPDPLQFLYDYDNPRDREAVALIAASLAYGRVAQILRSVQRVLSVLGKKPAEYLANADEKLLRHKFSGFVHRFTDETALAAFLSAMSRVYKSGATLQELFCSNFSGDVWSALEEFVLELAGNGGSFLLPLPSRGSACKRLMLFLRWMVRRDEVDPGGWTKIPASALCIPLDTHMFQICSEIGLCTRRGANGNAAREITDNFRLISPDDPAKYDFSLTRFGIRGELTYAELFERWKGKTR